MMAMASLSSFQGAWRGHDYWLLSLAGRGPFVFYAPTLRLALQVNGSCSESVLAGQVPQPLLDRLERGLLNPAHPIAPPASAFHLGIGLTRDCTLACRYCHAEADKPLTVPSEILLSAIRHGFTAAALTPRRVLSASFAVGGEPTMHWDLFRLAVSELRRPDNLAAHGLSRVFLSMTTNGYYGDTKRQFVADNFDTVTVSFDGTPKIQNLHRPTRGGSDSSDVVRDTIVFFRQKASLRVAVRSTVSSVSVMHLSDTVRYFAETFGRGTRVSFEPLIGIGRAQKDTELGTPDMVTFADQFLAAKSLARTLGLHVISSAPSTSRLVRRYCGAVAIPSFAVCVDGQITACHRDQDALDFGYGRIDAKGAVALSAQRLDDIAHLNDLPHECGECFLKWHCAGDCPDLRRIGWSRCEFNRLVAFDELRLLLSRKKGGETNGNHRSCSLPS
jgi:radical SAM additional 4Fe4S-binding domain